MWITGSEDRSGVGSDVGSVWITGREDRSAVGSDVGECVDHREGGQVRSRQ